jgi:hypothetical protein
VYNPDFFSWGGFAPLNPHWGFPPTPPPGGPSQTPTGGNPPDPQIWTGAPRQLAGASRRLEKTLVSTCYCLGSSAGYSIEIQEPRRSRGNQITGARSEPQGNQILISRDLLSRVSSKEYDDDTCKKVREVWQM